ncbi:hypothetical protein D3C80_1984900 [compost metagenome]
MKRGTRSPMSGGWLRQQSLADESAYIQRLVDERVDVDIGLARHLQCVMEVILLLFNYRACQGFGDR